MALADMGVGGWDRQAAMGGLSAFDPFASQFTTFITPTAGSIFRDSSGNTQPSWATSWTEGGNPVHASTGWTCDGVGDLWTSSGNPGNLDGTTLFVAFSASGVGHEGLVGARSSASTSSLGWDIRRNSSAASMVSAGDGTSRDTESVAYTADTYASVAVTFLQDASNSFVIYRDGVAQTSLDLTGFGTVYDATLPMTVGTVANAIALDGIIHGFVWNSTSLTTEEVATLHNYFQGVASG